jgi:broad-specificity NMP kinase
MSIVISGFPGVGKSHFAKVMDEIYEIHGERSIVIDHDSSSYSWIKNENGQRVRNPDFPFNYVSKIKKWTNMEIVLVSSHADVRDEMVKQKIPFILVYPADTEEMKKEFLKRYSSRGSNNKFIELLNDNWSEWISSCESQLDCSKVTIENHLGTLLGLLVDAGATRLKHL